MDPARFRRLVDIVGEALQHPESERPGIIERACGGDPELHAEASALVAEARATSLEAVTARIAAAVDDATRALPGLQPPPPDRVGPYHILGVLGEGGMGTVYHAEQTEPIRRDVALKMVRVGLRGESARARFERERQALAAMDHPGIARILDAGATGDGVPYFAMELVRGESITGWCDRRRLPVDARVDLFVDVCHAVQHAHIKGVIHRDLKPSNVLVAEVDGRARPRIIDFGIARAIEASGDAESMHTALGSVIGTLEYMSPEQAAGGATPVDTRADVYSLGVILYELVTGALPFESSALRVAGAIEAQRLIRDTDPPTPQRRFTAAVAREEIARMRGTDARTLHRRLAGDLGWVVMKALEKEPGRRYQSASDLAADLVRLRRNEPVEAGPPGRGYRASRFVRRHRTAVIAASVVFVALVAGATLATVGLVRAKRAQARAENEARRATMIRDFFTGMLGAARPENAKGRVVTVLEVVDSTAARMERERPFEDDPVVLAAVLQALAETYRSLDQHDRAVVLFERALSLRRAALGPDHDLTLNSLNKLSATRAQMGDLEAAIVTGREVLASRERTVGKKHPEYVAALSNLGNMHADLGQYDLAVPMLRESLAIDREVLGNDHADLAFSLNNLATVLVDQGDFAAAIPLHEESLALRRRHFGEPSAEVAIALGNYARALDGLARYAEAETAARAALAMSGTVFGDAHQRTATTRVRLAEVLLHTGRAAEAEALLVSAVAAFGATGERHWRTGDARARLGECLLALGRRPAGVAELEAGWDILAETTGADTPRCREIAAILAESHRRADAGVLADQWVQRAGTEPAPRVAP